jgi:type IV secretion system protein VirB5
MGRSSVFKGRNRFVLWGLVAFLGFSPGARAQWAVVDVGAIRQLLQQVQKMEQAIQTAENQLAQAQAQYQSMTGARGMQNLLPDVNRNYLSADFAQLATALAPGIRTHVAANAVLTPTQVAALSRSEQQQLMSARTNSALLQTASQQAYSNASARFASIQQLITAIGATQDQKAVLELQARVQAEHGMLQNENTKLQVLYQAAQAEEWARKQRANEQVVAGVGNLRTLPALRLP